MGAPDREEFGVSRQDIEERLRNCEPPESHDVKATGQQPDIGWRVAKPLSRHDRNASGHPDSRQFLTWPGRQRTPLGTVHAHDRIQINRIGA
jgi:hypothetical protein